MAWGVFRAMMRLFGRLGPTLHWSVDAVSKANLLAPGVGTAMGTATSCARWYSITCRRKFPVRGRHIVVQLLKAGKLAP